jgi:hypothetical protein
MFARKRQGATLQFITEQTIFADRGVNVDNGEAGRPECDSPVAARVIYSPLFYNSRIVGGARGPILKARNRRFGAGGTWKDFPPFGEC